MNKEELKIVLGKHKLWIESEKKEGERANLEGANLEGANLEFCDGFVKIGCENNTLDWWLKNYREVGTNNNYSEKDIENYGAILNFIKENFAEGKAVKEEGEGNVN